VSPCSTGAAGRKEIGVSQEFANGLYDPVKNGGGAIMDFGGYGAEPSIRWHSPYSSGIEAAELERSGDNRSASGDGLRHHVCTLRNILHVEGWG